ncbi:MAG: GNAT family N-acetyltransferase [Actinomycetota bacterium]
MFRELGPADAEACDAIIADLPAWFGHEQGILDCAAAVRAHAGFVVTGADGEITGFITFEPREPGEAEITWMAVRADLRRTGIGRDLLDGLCARLIRDGVRSLLVKTLSDRDGPYEEYDQTRAFALAMGFERVAELDIWGPENPALLMAKPL